MRNIDYINLGQQTHTTPRFDDMSGLAGLPPPEEKTFEKTHDLDAHSTDGGQ
jgi:hypothetical protein